MHVKFTMNLGSRDAESHGLKFSDCTAGSEVNVSDDIGQSLVAGNFAVAILKQVRGVSAAPSISEAIKPTIKAEPATAKAKQAPYKET